MERALIGALDLIDGVARGLVQLAMRLGQVLVRRALARYDTSVDDDEATLISQGWATAAGGGATAASQGLADQERRVVSMIVLRRDEKVVLHWWLTLFESAIMAATATGPLQADRPVLLRQTDSRNAVYN